MVCLRRNCGSAIRTDASHFLIGIHEGWTRREADDVVAALKKVEACYRR